MAAALAISGSLPNPFSRAWSTYERSLRRHPLATQAVTTTLLWGLGDGMAQHIELRSRPGERFDGRRMALTAAFGGAVVGPVGHVWYSALEHAALRLGLAAGLRSMAFKVLADTALYMPAQLLAFFAFGCTVVDGLSPAATAAKARAELPATLAAEALMWPPYMAAVFCRVPVQHQLLAVNVATLADVCFLSWARSAEDWAAALQQAVCAHAGGGGGRTGQAEREAAAPAGGGRSGRGVRARGRGGKQEQLQERKAKAQRGEEGGAGSGGGGGGGGLLRWVLPPCLPRWEGASNVLMPLPLPLGQQPQQHHLALMAASTSCCVPRW